MTCTTLAAVNLGTLNMIAYLCLLRFREELRDDVGVLFSEE